MYPLISSLPKGAATICNQFRTILLATGHVAAGDANSTVRAFECIEPNQRDKAYELALIQSIPFIGLPRVLHSAASLQAVGIIGNSSGSLQGTTFQESHHPNRQQLRESGEETFSHIYGRNTTRVRKRLQNFHPALDDWIITCVYGARLSHAASPDVNVSLRERELCAVASLCVDPYAAVQLASHLRGAIKVGATKDEIYTVIEQTEIICGERAAQSALAVWATYERARYAL